MYSVLLMEQREPLDHHTVDARALVRVDIGYDFDPHLGCNVKVDH